jgi:uncharacterized membrane protein YkvI
MTQIPLIMFWLSLAATIVLLSLIIILLLRRPMEQILSVNSYIQPSKVFYLRTFKIIILLAALSAVAGTDVPKKDQAFMEYVWWITSSLKEPLYYLGIWLMLYAAMLTVLFVVLGRLRD